MTLYISLVSVVTSLSFLILFIWSLFLFFLISLTEVKWSEVAQLCPTLCGPVGCSLPGSSVRGILQARMLELVTISFSRGTSWPRDRTLVSCIGGRRFNLWATREAQVWLKVYQFCVYFPRVISYIDLFYFFGLYIFLPTLIFVISFILLTLSVSL